MKKTFLNQSCGTWLDAIKVTGLLAVTAGTALAAPSGITNNVMSFDTAASVSGSWWLNGWGGQAAGTAYSATQDHTGNGGGSINVVDDFAGGSQCVQLGWFGGAWGSSPKYDLTLYTNVNFWVKWDTTASTIQSSTFNTTGEKLWLWGIGSGNNWINLAQFDIPEAASNGWAHINWLVDPTIPGINNLLGFGFKKWDGGGHTGVSSFYADDIQMVGSFVPPPPPSMKAPHKAAAGLNITSVTGPYNRESIKTVSTSDESFLTGGAKTYAFTVKQGVNGSGGAQFQNHIFLVPSPGSETAPDWNEPNVIMMDLESTTTGGTSWSFRYKTNCPNANNMLYNNGPVTGIAVTAGGSGYSSAPDVIISGPGAGAYATAQISGLGVVTNVVVATNGTGYVTAPSISFANGGGSGAAATASINPYGMGTLVTLTDSNILTGTWTLTVSGGNSFTMTTPSGQTTNVTIDATAAALFPAPVTAYFGAQAGNSAGVGQLSILSNVTITGTANPLNDTFASSATLNTNNWVLNENDANAILVIPGNANYNWVYWTLPATGYSLQSGNSLTSFTDANPIQESQFGTLEGALVATSGSQEFYRTIKRVATGLQVLFPGQTNAPGTLLGYTGTPTPISLNTQGLTPSTVTVNAVDSTFHIVSETGDNIKLTTSDGSATLPNNQGLVNGSVTFSGANGVLFQTTGSQTVTATDVDNTNFPAATSASISITP